MAQRRHHYEQAFEDYLRAYRIPYVAVDEAKKALLPEPANFRVNREGADGQGHEGSLKSFDFVIYGSPSTGLVAHDRQGVNLLVEVKGRKIGRRPRGGAVRDDRTKSTPRPRSAPSGAMLNRAGRLESWVTLEDIRSLQTWEKLFGPEFAAAFVFIYWCDEMPPDGLFQEVFDHRGRWYAVRAVTLSAYSAVMKTRSTRWGTVHVAPSMFERISQPLTGGPRGPRQVPEHLWRDPAPDQGPALPALA